MELSTLPQLSTKLTACKSTAISDKIDSNHYLVTRLLAHDVNPSIVPIIHNGLFEVVIVI